MDVDSVLAGFPIVVRWPVQWGDQDAFGHVNNTIYFRWFETCRIEYLERVGLRAMTATNQIGPILAAIRCQYRRPVVFPDTVHIAARVTRLGRSSFDMEHRLFSEAQGVLAAEGDSTIVVFDYAQQRSSPMDDGMRQAFEAMEGRKFD
jgi:acyl-CoA thioester hydrolase